MKILHKNNTKVFKNSGKCIAIGYPLEEKKFDGAIIKLSGRYPDSGRVSNMKCKELFYVISGSGVIEIENKKRKISKGSLIFIEPKEKYFWKGKMEMFVVSFPAWDIKQQNKLK